MRAAAAASSRTSSIFPARSAHAALIEAGDATALQRALARDERHVVCAINGPTGPWGRTLLMTASELGQAACVHVLLSLGARVGTTDTEGNAALHFASAGGHDAAVAHLLVHNADPFRLDGWGSSPLALAAAGGHAAVVARLLARIRELVLPPRPALAAHAPTPTALFTPGAVVSPASLGGGAQPAGEGEGEEEDKEELGRAVDSINNFGRTPLWKAACAGHAPVCRLLLEAGADMEREDDQGVDAVAIARDRGHADVVALLDGWKLAAAATAPMLPTVSPYSSSSEGTGGGGGNAAAMGLANAHVVGA